MKKKLSIILTTLIVIGGIFGFRPMDVAAQVSLYTPYTGLSITPGESINYSVDINNTGSDVEHVTFSLNNLPEDWTSTIRAGGNDIRQLSINAADSQEISLEIGVPLQVEKGEYEFELVAHGSSNTETTLPFLVEVSEEGTFSTELTIDQPNLEGHTDATFTYMFNLKNRTANDQNYSLSAQVPSGWRGQFKAGGDAVTSVSLEPGEDRDVVIDVIPAETAAADTYEIPIQATAGGTSAETTLEAVITGSYDLQLTTPDGNLSTEITAGRDKTIDLVVRNLGTAALNDIKLEETTPPEWSVNFSESEIETLESGESVTIQATLTSADDAIAGDYEASFSAKADEVSDQAVFRVSVQTSTLWGLIGVAIILVVLGGLYYLFRTYGRR